MSRPGVKTPPRDPAYLDALLNIRKFFPVVDLHDHQFQENFFQRSFPTYLGITLILQTKCLNCTNVNILKGAFAERLERLAVEIGADSATTFDGVTAMFTSGAPRIGQTSGLAKCRYLDDEDDQYSSLPADPRTARCVRTLKCLHRAAIKFPNFNILHEQAHPGLGYLDLRCTCNGSEVLLKIDATRPGIDKADLAGTSSVFYDALVETAYEEGMDTDISVCGLHARFFEPSSEDLPVLRQEEEYQEEEHPTYHDSDSIVSWGSDTYTYIDSPALDYQPQYRDGYNWRNFASDTL
ncbi:hypothetical protein E8E14_005232 [Neopestalotiopsis sp. 37M]|nr:hypothetical protein E8E14_005232 [Neopestalotiopsis sp. 37M]